MIKSVQKMEMSFVSDFKGKKLDISAKFNKEQDSPEKQKTFEEHLQESLKKWDDDYSR